MIGEPLCSRRRCIVVGSAPGVELPKEEPHDIVIAANGGAAVVRDAGREVDILVTTSHLFAGTTPVDRATLKRMRGLRARSIWVDTKNGTMAGMRVVAMRYDIEAPTYVDCKPHLRDKIIREAVGFEAWVSTGVFAACLALASRAGHVQLCGISLANGHDGIAWDQSQRHHVREDAGVLRVLGPQGVEMPPELVESVIH